MLHKNVTCPDEESLNVFIPMVLKSDRDDKIRTSVHSKEATGKVVGLRGVMLVETGIFSYSHTNGRKLPVK